MRATLLTHHRTEANKEGQPASGSMSQGGALPGAWRGCGVGWGWGGHEMAQREDASWSFASDDEEFGIYSKCRGKPGEG